VFKEEGERADEWCEIAPTPETTMRSTNRPSLVRSLALFACLAAGCQSAATRSSESPWTEPSKQLGQRIEQEAERLPWTHGLDRVQLIHWFATVGEPAYPKLLAMVEDPRSDVAGAALAALGATRDHRLVKPLRAIPAPEGEGSDELALERARTLLRLGDWAVMRTLIAGLRDERLMTRALCFQALSEATHERFDFDPRATEAERDAAIARWEAWWDERSVDVLLAE